MIDLLLPVEQQGQFAQHIAWAVSIADDLRRLGRWNIQKPIEIDAHRSIEDPTHQFMRVHPHQSALHCIREGETMMRGVPVAEFVAGRELRDAQRRRVYNHRREIDRTRALANRSKQRCGDCFADRRRDSIGIRFALSGSACVKLSLQLRARRAAPRSCVPVFAPDRSDFAMNFVPPSDPHCSTPARGW